jgi:hypothetical protein
VPHLVRRDIAEPRRAFAIPATHEIGNDQLRVGFKRLEGSSVASVIWRGLSLRQLFAI